MTRRILVAGGAGFIGTHLVKRLLDAGCDVVVADSLRTGRLSNLKPFAKNPAFDFVKADISEPLPDFGAVDAVYNLACAASPVHYQADPVHTLQTSVAGTFNLLTLAEKGGARLVMASTSEIYGDPDEHPQRETYNGNVNPIGPRACYDEGKRAAETLCAAFKGRGTDVRVARIFNTYGPHMRCDDGRVVSNVICQALAGEDITIYGSGDQTRSFCYVSDLVEGLIRLMDVDREIPTPVNLGNPGEFTVSELVQLVMEMVPTSSRVVHKPLPVDDPRRRCPDISLARKCLDWGPEIPLRKGLVPTVEWFRSQNRTSGSRRVEKPVAAAAS